jgi:tRNA(Ile)-lysidine synthase
MNGPASGQTLDRRFMRHARRTGLLRDDVHILVALSGGLDSCVLLHLLRFIPAGPRLSAAHFDHAMRRASAADADWVRGLCVAWAVPLFTQRADAPPVSEEAARDLRYAFLDAAVALSGADAIVTAHHADDQAETLLFRLARGTGVTGLAGIPERRGIIARPLLPFLRTELTAYARAVGLRWREDPTNAEPQYDRNRVRRSVLPALESIRPGATGRIASLAARAADAESAWKQVVRGAIRRVLLSRDATGYTLARERLLDYHPHIRARVIRRLLATLGSRPGRAGTDVALQFISTGVSGSRIEVTGGIVLEREFDRLLLRSPRSGTASVDVSLRIPTADAGAGNFVAGDRTFQAYWTLAQAGTGSGQTASFDPSSLRFPLELRAWRAGDRIRLAYGSKKLKKLFLERRVGRARRRAVAVLSDAMGSVLWVVGLQQSVVAQPGQAQTVFQITVVDGDTE